MPCPKCRGHLIDTPEECYCQNCGLRPILGLPPGIYASPPPPPIAPGQPARRAALTALEIATILADKRLPLRERLKRAGLCVICGKKKRTPAKPGATMCPPHIKAVRDYQANYAKQRHKGAA